MVNNCSVTGCSNRSNRDMKSFYVLPGVIHNQGETTQKLSEARRLQWLNNMNRDGFTPSRNTRICSDHFISGKPSALYDTTSLDWAPTLKMGYVMTSPLRPVEGSEQLKREIQRKCHSEAAKLLLNFSSKCLQEPQVEDVKNDHDYVIPVVIKTEEVEEEEEVKMKIKSVSSIETQTDPMDPSPEMIQRMRNEIQALTSENMSLREELKKRKSTEECLKDDDERVKYYSGFPSYSALMTAFDLVAPLIRVCTRSPMTKFDKFFMSVTKLKMNTSIQDLAYRYGVPVATAFRAFRNVVDVLHERLSPQSSVSEADLPFDDKVVAVVSLVNDFCRSAQVKKSTN